MIFRLKPNHPAIAHAAEIKQICSPLQRYLGVTTFCYIRIYPNLSRIHIGTKPEWSEVFYQNAYQYYMKGGFLEGRLRHTGCNPTDLLEHSSCLRDARSFDVGKGVARSHFQKDYFEIGLFMLPCDSTTIDLLRLLNSTEMLDDFLIYFKKQAHLILEGYKKNLIFLPFLKTDEEIISLSVKDQIRKSFYEEIEPKENKKLTPELSINADSFFTPTISSMLTPKEQECLLYYLSGRTAKETARVMKISYRTVEKYIDRIRLKTNSQRRSELFDKCVDSGMINIYSGFPDNL